MGDILRSVHVPPEVDDLVRMLSFEQNMSKSDVLRDLLLDGMMFRKIHTDRDRAVNMALQRSNVINIVREFSKRIKNGRSAQDILNHLKGEVQELQDEIDGNGDGKDGVYGEAIDIMQCCLDLIFKDRPLATDAEITDYMFQKCEKWEFYYSKTILKDTAKDQPDAE